MKIPEQFRYRLFKALLGPTEYVRDNTVLELLEGFAAHDLNAIEPIIEELLDHVLGQNTRPN